MRIIAHVVLGRDVVQVISVARNAAKHTDWNITLVRRIARVLQSRPAGLEEQAVLRIHELCFARVDAEERRIELVDIIEREAVRNVRRIIQHTRVQTCGDQIVGRNFVARLDAVDQVAPELFDISCTGQSRRHTYDSQVLVTVGRSPCLLVGIA